MALTDKSVNRQYTLDELHNENTDRSVIPVTMVRGMMYKSSATGTWQYWDGTVMATFGGTVVTSPLSADSSSVSAKQSDASNLRVSAFSEDASNFRVSALGVNIADISNSDAADFRVSAIQGDASLFRVSALGVSSVTQYTETTSAVSATGVLALAKTSANFFHALLLDANNNLQVAQQGTVSALLTEATSFIGQVSATLKAGTANIGYVSAVVDNGSLSAKSTDAGTFLVSAKQGDASLLRTSGILDSGSVSAKSGDANQLHVSSVQGDAALLRISALQSGTWALSALLKEGTAFVGQVSANQAGTWALSALLKEGTAFVGQVSVAGGQLSATAKEGTAFIGNVSATLKAGTANIGYVSAFIDNGSLSAKSSDAGTFLVSAKSDDAGILRVSNFQGDAANFRTSAFIDSGSVSAKQGDANNLHVSAVQGDAGLFRISAYADDAAKFRISGIGSFDTELPTAAALADDTSNPTVPAVGAFLMGYDNSGSNWDRVRTVALGQTTMAGSFPVVIASNQSYLSVSAVLSADATGQLTIGRLSNLSSSGNIKSTAGAIYGYEAYNIDTKLNYINLTNTSGAINVGTDSVIMKIVMPASSHAYVEYAHGLKGFTNGIGAYAVSSILDTATTAAATSTVGINIFYI